MCKCAQFSLLCWAEQTQTERCCLRCWCAAYATAAALRRINESTRGANPRVSGWSSGFAQQKNNKHQCHRTVDFSSTLQCGPHAHYSSLSWPPPSLTQRKDDPVTPACPRASVPTVHMLPSSLSVDMHALHAPNVALVSYKISPGTASLCADLSSQHWAGILFFH